MTGYSATAIWTLVGALVLVTLLARNFFLVLPERWQPRGWVEQALRVAPLAALLAITVPEITRDVSLEPSSWLDPRLVAALLLVVVVRATGRTLWGLVAGAALYLLLGSLGAPWRLPAG
jgi:branched-subunit amino acid transport protein